MIRRQSPPRRTPLARMSAKRRKTNRERRKAVEAVFGQRPACAAQLAGCTGWADDAHELLSRARGGSITEVSNIVPLCRPCHRYITEHPAWAEANGWLAPSWGGDAA